MATESAPKPKVAADREAGGNGENTRARLIDAAVGCILEKGYYRASSNEIARRAGVSWGVIQYHFGTRERLMLAVFEDSLEKLLAVFRTERTPGSSTLDELTSYFDLLMSYYGRPAYLAHLEVNLNLTRDPGTSAETLAGLRRLSAELQRHDFLPAGIDRRHSSLVFESLRGLILSHQLRSDASITVVVDDDASFQRRARDLIRALAVHIDAADAQ